MGSLKNRAEGVMFKFSRLPAQFNVAIRANTFLVPNTTKHANRKKVDCNTIFLKNQSANKIRPFEQLAQCDKNDTKLFGLINAQSISVASSGVSPCSFYNVFSSTNKDIPIPGTLKSIVIDGQNIGVGHAKEKMDSE